MALGQGRKDTGLGWDGELCLGGIPAHMTSSSSFLPSEELAGLPAPGREGGGVSQLLEWGSPNLLDHLSTPIPS